MPLHRALACSFAAFTCVSTSARSMAYPSLASFAIGVIHGTRFRTHHLARYRIERSAFGGRFLGRRRTQGSQVVSGFEATYPCELVRFIQRFARCSFEIQVQALRLIDPLLPARRSL